MAAAAVGYLRVSTREQGESRLGLEAQRVAIESFASREGYSLVAWHQDVQTGKGADALTQRPGLREALKAAKAARGALLVSKLDRLGRNSHFITGLVEQRIRFVIVSMPNASAFEIQLHAAFAEEEARKISTRTTEALARSKKKLGMAGKSKQKQRAIRALALAAKGKAAQARAEQLRPQLEFALKDGASLRVATRVLNERGVESPMGGRWHTPSLLKAARRLGLR
jgi:DNA invertase Pin-like site-specific DNA recombinase